MPVTLESLPAGAIAPAASRGAGAAPAAPGAGFADSLQRSLGSLIDGVEQTQDQANEAVTNMVNKTGEVHDAMIALQRAQVHLEMTVAIRNKLVSAYQEIMRMPV